MVKQPWTKKVNNVRIIRDLQNNHKDYYIPEKRAKELFDEGKLIKIEAYTNRWCYSTRDPDEYFD